MNSDRSPQKGLKDIEVNVKLKLAAAWESFMFLYIYIDYFQLYMPSFIEDLLSGQVFEFDITLTFLLVVLSSPYDFPVCCLTSHWTNIIVATIYIPYTLFNLAGEAWHHMIFGAAIEVVLLLLIIWYALKWPKK